jgi:hypothetical protein
MITVTYVAEISDWIILDEDVTYAQWPVRPAVRSPRVRTVTDDLPGTLVDLPLAA